LKRNEIVPLVMARISVEQQLGRLKVAKMRGQGIVFIAEAMLNA
jgi:hypothetical protein